MDPRVASFEPSQLARRRAERAGIDLERLRHEDPEQFAMFCADRAVEAPAVLLSTIAGEIADHFPRRRWFEMPAKRQGQGILLAFPPLDEEELARLDDVLAKLAAREDFADHYAYFRVVNDLHGERREFGVALAPSAYSGEAGVMVGPFASRGDVEDWLKARLAGSSTLTGDPISYGGHWFADVFELSLPD